MTCCWFSSMINVSSNPTPEGQWSPLRQISMRERPMRLLSDETSVYALADPQAAQSFPLQHTAPGLASFSLRSSIESAPAQWWLLRQAGDSWQRVAPTGLACDSEHPGKAAPKACLTPEHLIIAAKDPQGDTIRCNWVSRSTWNLDSQQTLPAPAASNHWVLFSNRQVYLLIASNDPTTDSLTLLRAVSTQSGQQTWEAISLSSSKVPIAEITGVLDAANFNQHVALLIKDRDQNVQLTFIRPDGAATETGFDVAERIASRDTQSARGVTIHMLMTAVPLVLLAMTLAFRHQALRTLPPLSPVAVPALFSQRLVGALIDLLPFLWATAYTLNLEVGPAFQEFIAWSFAGAETDQPAPTKILIWWFASLGMHAIYMCVIEGLTGRSVGKIITRTRIVTTSLHKPTTWQIILRNLTRPLELLPPWPLAIVVVLTLKRQRVGDTWAETMVITTRPQVLRAGKHTIIFGNQESAKDASSQEPPADSQPPSTDKESNPSDDADRKPDSSDRGD
jgi:uncharacterized RDD family membrane protein YckC